MAALESLHLERIHRKSSENETLLPMRYLKTIQRMLEQTLHLKDLSIGRLVGPTEYLDMTTLKLVQQPGLQDLVLQFCIISEAWLLREILQHRATLTYIILNKVKLTEGDDWAHTLSTLRSKSNLYPNLETFTVIDSDAGVKEFDAAGFLTHKTQQNPSLRKTKPLNIS